MLEALLLIGAGALLAKVGLMPLQEHLNQAQKRRDEARAAEIVEAVHAEVDRRLGVE